MQTRTAPLLSIYGRNVEVNAFKRGWSTAQLATRLGITPEAMRRIRTGKNRSIDPDVLSAMTDLFQCDYNALLTPQPGIDYTNDA
jgi:DNA-binding Xre family transcriptional regulator